MTKTEAMALLGVSTVRGAAELMGISQPAVSQWPEELGSRQIVRVEAALYRKQQAEKAAALKRAAEASGVSE